MSSDSIRLEGLTVLDLNGEVVPVERLWADQPVLLVFLRHFGCVFCREQAARLSAARGQFADAGVKLVAIGNGNVAMARDFVNTQGPQIEVYTDPRRDLYRRAGLKRRFGIGPKALWRAIQAARAGHRQGRTQGDPWQQGGAILVGPGGRVLYHHVDRSAGDHAAVEDLLAAAQVTVG